MEGRAGRSRGKTAGNTTLKAEARKNTILKKEGFGRGIQGGKVRRETDKESGKRGESVSVTMEIMNFFRKHLFASGLVLILLFGLVYVKDEVTLSGIESSRMATVESLVDYGTFAIDRSRFGAVDKVLLEGHAYSDKPLLIQLWAACFYFLLRHLTGIGFPEHYHLTLFLIHFVCFYSLNFLLYAFFYRLMSRRLPSSGEGYRVFSSLAVIFSTMIFSYSVTINNHTPAALTLFLLLLLFSRGEEKGLTRMLALGAGVLCGLLLNQDYIFGGVFGISSFFWILFRRREERPPKERMTDALCYAAGAWGVIFLCLGINVLAYGSPFPLYWTHTHKVLLRAAAVPTYIFHSTFGFKGIFFYMPALLFVLPGILKKGFFRTDPLRCMMLCSAGAVMILYWLVTMEYGGWSFGFRYFIPLIPLLFYYAALDLGGWSKSFRCICFVFCVGWGVFTSSLGAYEPWCIAWEPHITGDKFLKFRNSVWNNFFCREFEQAPDSALVRWQMEDLYGVSSARNFLFFSFLNMRKFEAAAELLKRYPDEEMQKTLLILLSQEEARKGISP